VSLKDLRLSFVIPWYGADIPGGAEAQCRLTAEHLAETGADVEVLTTCVRDFLSDWNTDFFRPGTEVVNGVPVRRFPVRKRDTRAFDAVNWKLMNRLPVTAQEERIFVSENVRSDALCRYIEERGDGRTYVFIPYMFGTTYWGLQVRPEQSFLMPCLHDESYAYLDIFKPVFDSCRGMLFLTPAELDLARRLYALPPERLKLTGGGIDADFASNGDQFRSGYGITEPFLLYAGRRDATKNVPLLIDFFARVIDQTPNSSLKLVLIGAGKLPPLDPRTAKHIVDLGFVTQQDKYDAYAAALALCQPSINESFSIVMLEAWLAGTPVLVHADCAATRDHCVRSNGGLYFGTYDEFSGCVDFFLREPEIGQRMGELGREYVRANYTWSAVLERLERALN
jgi:glycosyltransferase involved in cell wall biosynthesis